MLSVSGKNWEEIKVNHRILEKIKNDYNFSDILSKLIISKNFSSTEISSITNDIKISNPFLKNNDFEVGKKIIDETISKNKKILIIGDYDVDGCISTALLKIFFSHLNKEVNFYIPNRLKDGYGASITLIKKLTKIKPDLVIMVDCGSNSLESIKYLKSKNIETIIIDHHEVFNPYLKIKCFINPKKDCDYKIYDYLCSSSLVYFFIDNYIKKKKLNIRFENNLIYVLLATVCDVMPIRKLNRIIALNVLKKFNITENFLFNKIFSIKKIKRPFKIDDLGFLIGPILNSAGRLKDANIVVNLITSNDSNYIESVLNKLILLNEKRKFIESNILNNIDFNEIKKKNDNVVVEFKDLINEGIIGIIAAKLKDYFNKPSVILTKSGNFYKASARSTPDFNIGKYIKKCIDKKIIISGGGHNLAAGFNIKKEKIEEFNYYINNLYKKSDINNSKKYLSKISLSAVNFTFFNELKKIGPNGHGNNSPIFLLENVKILKPRIFKNKFVSFYAKSTSGKLFPGISFSFLESNTSSELLYNKNSVNLIAQIKENFWNNKKNLQLIVLDVIRYPNKA
ncbi:DHH family phosphoesterase [Pelagibacterales bacterium SAG-MED39]|nr:DHH family phosphoesterase [Pelagibacterales bacterium SAG-MED39]